MASNKDFPKELPYTQVRALVDAAKLKWPNCRPGQAVCNEYDLPVDIHNKIYEDTDTLYVTYWLHHYSWSNPIRV